MGVDVGLILSDDRHYIPFVCAICQNLVDLDALVTTTQCSHCFCKNCLQFWLERSTTCPTCNCDLIYNGGGSKISSTSNSSSNNNNNSMMIGRRTVMVHPLSSCQPLAYRLLKRVLVKCPLNSHTEKKDGIVVCNWKGDYCDLETHLLSPTAHEVQQPVQPESSTTTANATTTTTTTSGGLPHSPADRNKNIDSENHHDMDSINPSTSTLPNKVENTTQQSSATATGDHVKQEQQELRLRKQSLAASLKEEANGKFESQHYKEAISLYTKAIEVLQGSVDSNDSSKSVATATTTDDYFEQEESKKLLATLYSNRAASYLQVRNYTACVQDCRFILSNLKDSSENNKLAKVYIRISRAMVQLGQLEQAKQYLEEGLVASPPSSDARFNDQAPTPPSTTIITSKQKLLLQKSLTDVEHYLSLEKQGHDHLSNQRFADAKATYSTLLKEAPSVIPFLLGAAQADLGLGLIDSTLRLTKVVLIQHAQNPIAYWIRGQAMFAMCDTDLGLKLQLEALRLDPDSQLIKDSYRRTKKVVTIMKDAEQCMFRRDFTKAAQLFTDCIKTCQSTLAPKAPLYATFHTRRAEAYLRLKDYSSTLKDCGTVLYYHDDNISAILIRLKAYHGLEQHETALLDVQELLQKYPNDMQLRQAHDHAEFLYRKSRRVDYYKLLGVSSIASEMEIKKAYKRKALEYHPDKHTQDRQEYAQKQFQSLGDALEILCDDFTRRLYDEGYDLEQIRERVEAAKQAAHNHHHRSYTNPHHHW